jgi:hypothetical protein
MSSRLLFYNRMATDEDFKNRIARARYPAFMSTGLHACEYLQTYRVRGEAFFPNFPGRLYAHWGYGSGFRTPIARERAGLRWLL